MLYEQRQEAAITLYTGLQLDPPSTFVPIGTRQKISKLDSDQWRTTEMVGTEAPAL